MIIQGPGQTYSRSKRRLPEISDKTIQDPGQNHHGLRPTRVAVVLSYVLLIDWSFSQHPTGTVDGEAEHPAKATHGCKEVKKDIHNVYLYHFIFNHINDIDRKILL